MLLGQNARLLAGAASFRRGQVGQKTGLGFYCSVHSCFRNTETKQPGKLVFENEELLHVLSYFVEI